MNKIMYIYIFIVLIVLLLIFLFRLLIKWDIEKPKRELLAYSLWLFPGLIAFVTVGLKFSEFEKLISFSITIIITYMAFNQVKNNEIFPEYFIFEETISMLMSKFARPYDYSYSNSGCMVGLKTIWSWILLGIRWVFGLWVISIFNNWSTNPDFSTFTSLFFKLIGIVGWWYSVKNYSNEPYQLKSDEVYHKSKYEKTSELYGRDKHLSKPEYKVMEKRKEQRSKSPNTLPKDTMLQDEVVEEWPVRPHSRISVNGNPHLVRGHRRRHR